MFEIYKQLEGQKGVSFKMIGYSVKAIVTYMTGRCKGQIYENFANKILSKIPKKKLRKARRIPERYTKWM